MSQRPSPRALVARLRRAGLPASLGSDLPVAGPQWSAWWRDVPEHQWARIAVAPTEGEAWAIAEELLEGVEGGELVVGPGVETCHG